MSTELASDNDLMDRILDKGIVVEVWDRMGIAGIDLAGTRITISLFELFAKGENPTFRMRHFWKVEPL